MRVYLDSLGCRLNEAELASWRMGFREAGHGIALRVEDADVAVFNSCAVTQDASRSSRKSTRRLHRLNPDAKIVLTGCYASLEPEEARGLEGVDLLVSNTDKDRLVQRVLAELPSWEMPARAEVLEEETDAELGDRSRAFVKVQDGCRHKCTYCIVTRARGEERSRSIREITDEVNRHHAAGHAEAVLTGVHLGGYGNDLGVELTDLIEALLRDTAIPRIRIGSLEPWRLDERFFALWGRSERLMPHLHLPLQSGSDSVLKRMGRRCSQAGYAALVDQARSSIPDLHLSTDIIVGFPGETETEFEEGLSFSEAMGFGQVHLFSYSPRAGTKAAEMSGQLDRATKRERSQRIHEAAVGWKQKAMTPLVGREAEVLWERPVEGRDWQGYTKSYFRVLQAPPAQNWRRGMTTRVRLEGLEEGSFRVNSG